MYALIVDDEKKAREALLQIIKIYCPEITKTEEADSVKTAVNILGKNTPDILFLDIRLGDGNGFDILKKAPQKALNVVFTTAYNEYAIKALRISAIDYLLKPIDPDELIEAVSRVSSKLSKNKTEQRLELLLDTMENKMKPIHKITLKTVESIHIVPVADIVYCESEHSYTTFYLIDERKVTVSKNLKEYEDLLPTKNFMRSHQSFLVNINHVTRYDKTNNWLITSTKANIPVAIRKKEQLMQYLKNNL
jgi:two-component system LytT family response regulator